MSRDGELYSAFCDAYRPIAPPDEIARRYDVLSCLKHTDSRQVYLLREREGGRRLLLKCGQNEQIPLLQSEYAFLSSARLPCLPAAVDCFVEGGVCCFIREYIEGDTIEDIVERGGGLPQRQAVSILNAVCDAVHALHSLTPPRIHRDLKPQNILLTPDGQIKLIDLETVRAYDPDAKLDTVFLGTRKTAAPEQYGYEQTGVRTDVYALGVLFCFLLTGQYDPRGQAANGISPAARIVIRKCTAFDPRRRYRSVPSLQRALRRFSVRPRGWAFAAVAAAVLFILLIIIQPHAEAAQAPVSFANPRIEQAARKALGKADNEPLYAEELASIQTLLICGDRVFASWAEHELYHAERWYEFNDTLPPSEPMALDDLACFTGLSSLALDCLNVSDIGVLSGLSLRQLSLHRNSITDISPLAACEGLEVLWLAENPITSLEPLSALSSLAEIDISQTGVSNISPLAACPIKALSCQLCGVRDYGVLSSFPALSTLRISDADSETVLAIGKLKSLRQLALIDSEIADLSPLYGLSNLESLDLSLCGGLSSIEGVEHFPNLFYLSVLSTNVSDIRPIAALPRLTSFECAWAPINDLSLLDELPLLKIVYLNGEMAAMLRAQVPETRFAVAEY